MNSSLNYKTQKPDLKFSLGLSFYEIMDITQIELEQFLIFTPREEIIDWLEWNDPNGVYRDQDSLREFGNIMSKEDGAEILIRQIFQ
jgi:hypothetical protein